MSSGDPPNGTRDLPIERMPPDRDVFTFTPQGTDDLTQELAALRLQLPREAAAKAKYRDALGDMLDFWHEQLRLRGQTVCDGTGDLPCCAAQRLLNATAVNPDQSACKPSGGAVAPTGPGGGGAGTEPPAPHQTPAGPPAGLSTTDNLFHRLWTKAVGTPRYIKAEWQALEAQLFFEEVLPHQLCDRARDLLGFWVRSAQVTAPGQCSEPGCTRISAPFPFCSVACSESFSRRHSSATPDGLVKPPAPAESAQPQPAQPPATGGSDPGSSATPAESAEAPTRRTVERFWARCPKCLAYQESSTLDGAKVVSCSCGQRLIFYPVETNDGGLSVKQQRDVFTMLGDAMAKAEARHAQERAALLEAIHGLEDDLRAAHEAALYVPEGHCNRCSYCGWEFSRPHGCRPTNCSQRPMPAKRTHCAGCAAPFSPRPERIA